MSLSVILILLAGCFIVSVLYSSVGHAGASGYIAVMSLLNLAPEEIKPAALSLNILVATIAAYKFYRAGYFSWPLFWPFALFSVPAAFVGGYIMLPAGIFNLLVGAILFLSGIRFLFPYNPESEIRKPGAVVQGVSGGGIGLLSGLTGTGGGIFLTPLMLFMRWATAKQAAAVSSLFILLNSSAGLTGHAVSHSYNLPGMIIPLAVTVVAGGLIGSHLGSRVFPEQSVKRALAVVLLIAGTKLIFY